MPDDACTASTLIRARYLVPVRGNIIEDAAIRVVDGAVAEMGPARDITGDAAQDFGDAAILPGLVNAHTHLELSHLANQVPPSADFTDWLRRLVASFKQEPLTEKRVAESVRSGIAQSIRGGVTTLGDISREPQWSRPWLRRSPLRAVSFGEVIAIGNRRGALEERLTRAAALTDSGDRLHIGISPHAPYTLEPNGLRLCAAASIEQGAPLCIHLAETREESEFTCSRTGDFVAYLHDLGVWDELIPIPGKEPIPLAASVGLLGKRTVVAHANYVSGADVHFLAATGASVAYCPRTHHAFGHDPHPFRKMLQAGINVCVGTDSLATNPSLHLLDELRFMRQHHTDIDALQIVQMGTINGATALGLEKYAGTIEVGETADLVVLPLPPGRENTWYSWLDAADSPVAVYLGGSRYQDSAPGS
ncbi:MAG: amidohydrolase family protein [Planctomycetota bacterium]|jgi:cytosine/adenosine deaminase-related metal-dependent hydrolase